MLDLSTLTPTEAEIVRDFQRALDGLRANLMAEISAIRAELGLPEAKEEVK